MGLEVGGSTSMVSATWMLSTASTPVFCQKVKCKALRGHPTSGRLKLLLYFQFFCVLCPACFASKRQACLCVLSSFSQLYATLWTVAHQAPLSMGSSRQKTGVGCHALLQGILPTRGSNPCLLYLLHQQVGSLPGKPSKMHIPYSLA